MSRPSVLRKVFTIGWSIGLAVVLILVTGVLLLPGTKSASIRFERVAETLEESIEEPTAEDVALWTSNSTRIDRDPMVVSEREAADTTRERPQDESGN